MNTRELENAILLRQSGELSDADTLSIEKALEADPALASLAEENDVLMEAVLFSSQHCIPPLPELNREQILEAGKAPEKTHVKQLLALAALLVLGLALLPHLTRSLPSAPQVYSAEIAPIRSTLDAQDPILSSLEELEYELSLWTSFDGDDPAFLENESDWATTLTTLEDSI